jgi:predicted ATPase
MKIKNVRLIDFKRFTDLTITDIPETTRLVMMVGPNGSGKSSVLDGFSVMQAMYRGSANFTSTYHIKADFPDSKQSGWYLMDNHKVTVDFYDAERRDWHSPKLVDMTRFYIRTGYRYEPEFIVNSISKQGLIQDEKQPERLMEIEGRVAKNYQRLIARSIEDIYNDEKDDNTTKRELRDGIIGKVSEAFNRVLSGAKLLGLGNPLNGGSFFFEKGTSRNWPYNNLSAGEKAVFDLILDFILKSETYNNTVFCIDEPEVHVNANFHSALLNELYSSLPGQSQLWIATHSASMMRRARELEEATPGTVVFLDFGSQDFDEPAILRPAITNRQFWQRNFSVAIGELAALVAPKQVFICEGDPKGNQNKDFDARCYSTIFGTEFPDAVFISAGGSTEVKDKTNFISGIFSQFLPDINTTFILDRDDRTPTECEDLIAQGKRILKRRHLEAYLLDDEILERFCLEQGKPEIWPALQAEKQSSLAGSEARGNPSDDWKATGGTIRVAAKRIYARPFGTLYNA